jgi:DNA-binding response OmpR family regulator
VISDVMMPNLDGAALVHEIRNDPAISHLPIILVSARAGEDARVEGMATGADDYLTKPFTGRELVARVAAHLSLSAARRASEERERELRKEAELLNEVALNLAAELDLAKLLQSVTDAATSLTAAEFGAFFYNQGWASSRSSCHTSSSGSDRQTPRSRVTSAGWAWASRSSSTWSSCTAGRSKR